LATETRIKQISALYVTIFDRTPTIAELDSYLNLNQNIKLEVISSMMMANSPLKSNYISQDTQTIVKNMFQSIFGYTETEMNTIIQQQQYNAQNGGINGFDYWVNELENNKDMININTLAIALLNGADEASYTRAMNVNEVKETITNYSNKYNLNIQIEELIENNQTIPTDNSNINIGKTIYVESKITTDVGNDGTIDYVSNYTYSYENGILSQYSDGHLEAQLKFDSNGLLIEEISMFDDVIHSVTNYTYNSNGQLLSVKEVSSAIEISTTFNWSLNSVTGTGNMFFVSTDTNSILKGISTGLNTQKNAPLKWEQYLDDKLSSISYFTYDSNGNEIKMLEDEDADGIVDYAYQTEWIALG
jgi:hypothetical protein